MVLLPGKDRSDRMRVLFLPRDAAPEMKIVSLTLEDFIESLYILKDECYAEAEERVITVDDDESVSYASTTAEDDA